MVFVLLLGTFATVLMQTSLATALPNIMESFDVNLATAQWLTTIFLLANGIMIPVSAFLAVRVPTRTLYLSSLAIFFAGTLIAFVTPSSMFWLLLVGRVLQAVAVGISMPLLQVVMVSIFPASERGKAMGLSGLVVGLAPAIGPTFSGWILNEDHHFLGIHLPARWETIFGIELPLIAVIFIASIFCVKNVLPNEKIKLNIRSLIESSIGFGALLYGFASVSEDGWLSPTVLISLAVGTVVLIEFVWHQLHMKNPFMDVRVFANKQFSILTAMAAIAMIAMLGVEMVLPTYLQNLRGMTPLDSGLTLLPGAIVMGILAPSAGAAFDRIGVKRLAIIGFLIVICGTIPLFFVTQDSPVLYITAVYALRMFGIALVFMPVIAAAMSALNQNQITQGTAANNTARQVAAAMGTAILVSVLQNVQNKNSPSSDLVGGKSSQDLLKSMQDNFAGVVDQLNKMAGTNLVEYLHQSVNASLDGFHAAFFLAACFGIAGLLLTLTLKNVKPDHAKKSVTDSNDHFEEDIGDDVSKHTSDTMSTTIQTTSDQDQKALNQTTTAGNKHKHASSVHNTNTQLGSHKNRTKRKHLKNNMEVA